MFFPKGRIVHENLNTAYTQIEPLLADLKNNQFTGYVRLAAWEFEGVLLLDTGSVVNAVVEEKQQRRSSGMAALEAIAAKAKEKDGVISVHALSEEIVTTLAGMARSELVHKDLDSDFTSLDKLIAKLQSDQHTGYVRVSLKDDNGQGIVFLQSGKPVRGFFYRDGELLNGAQALTAFTAAAAKFSATFDIYAEPMEQRDGESTSIRAGLGLSQWIKVWEEILARAEQTADGLSAKGRFLDVYQHTLVEKASQYHFLDPFAKKFEYEDGCITYRGGIEPKFNQALSECLTATVTTLATEMPRANLTLKTKVALQTVKQKYPAAIEILAEETTLDLLSTGLYEHVIAEAQPYLLDKTEDFIARQCREHLGIEPQTLGTGHLGELARWVETSAALFIPHEQAQALRRKIEALAERTTPKQGGKT